MFYQDNQDSLLKSHNFVNNRQVVQLYQTKILFGDNWSTNNTSDFASGNIPEGWESMVSGWVSPIYDNFWNIKKNNYRDEWNRRWGFVATGNCLNPVIPNKITVWFGGGGRDAKSETGLLQLMAYDGSSWTKLLNINCGWYGKALGNKSWNISTSNSYLAFACSVSVDGTSYNDRLNCGNFVINGSKINNNIVYIGDSNIYANELVPQKI